MALITKAIRGTQDVLPSESAAWQHIERTALAVARDYGFREVRTPVFEHTELFTRSVGETTDVVQKEMYTFDDKGRMTGAFDKTANREYLPAGNFGNILTVTTDRPVRNDAWDIATEYWTAVTKEAECTAISPVTAGAAGMSMESRG